MHKDFTVESYKPRFVSAPQLLELINLYHLARGAGKLSRYDRLIWASSEFHKANPQISATAAYKDLSAQLEQ
jgi:hypothetical protein